MADNRDQPYLWPVGDGTPGEGGTPPPPGGMGENWIWVEGDNHQWIEGDNAVWVDES